MMPIQEILTRASHTVTNLGVSFMLETHISHLGGETKANINPIILSLVILAVILTITRRVLIGLQQTTHTTVTPASVVGAITSDKEEIDFCVSRSYPFKIFSSSSFI
jgi:hypothetical protein